ncbi:MAG TPA: NAD(P)-dependent alcohol dehydrogenase, partial [Anaerolineales bacterium]|nr:NAD(P)-dependent alcohol dehydrogenase [Anaerolineales bacterium]
QSRGPLGPGRHVLINGASGGVGTFAVQLARALGAEVTAVVSPRNLEQARALGADHVLDYTTVDLNQSGARYDLILAVNGYQPIGTYQRALCPGGHYVMIGGSAGQMFQAMLLGPLLSRKGGSQLGLLQTRLSVDDLAVVKRHLEAGSVRPVIDRVFPFDAIPDALRYVEAGHARAKVVIAIGADSASR